MKNHVIDTIKYFDDLVTNPKPMTPFNKSALKKLAELYEWELLKTEFRKALHVIAKERGR